MFSSAMKCRKGEGSEIGELLNGHDDFTEKHVTILRNFTRGKLVSGSLSLD